jgi:2-methylisocitrate lyase-like PEP mutase family enzyme
MNGLAARFRALHARDGIFVMPNPWDAGSAKVVRHLGFEALATGSAPFAASLGRRDGQVAREEAVGHASMISAVTGLPVNGDLERGYGDHADDVYLTVQQAIVAGLAGCSIEDATGRKEKPLYDRADAVERIRAARSAIDEAGSAFVLTARCEAYLTGHEAPLQECLERLGEMAEAGADVVYACGMAAADDIAELVRAVPRPVNVPGGTGPEPLSVAALRDLGVKRVSLGPRLLQAAMGAYLRACHELKGEGTFGFMAGAANMGEVYAMFGGGSRT